MMKFRIGTRKHRGAWQWTTTPYRPRTWHGEFGSRKEASDAAVADLRRRINHSSIATGPIMGTPPPDLPLPAPSAETPTPTTEGDHHP